MQDPNKSSRDIRDAEKTIKLPESFRLRILPCLIAAALLGAGCGSSAVSDTQAAAGTESPGAGPENLKAASEAADDRADAAVIEAPPVTLSDIPGYDGELWALINNNIPYFSDDEITTDVFEEYSEPDSLGRCGTAYANICKELMPTKERGDISEIHPTGWHSSFYDFIDEGSLYNRCHLIAHELAGEDANERNLITGTRTFNKDGMQPFENLVADYVHETGNHVLYRVTPLFEGDDLVARGVLMEAYSVEDEGEGVCFCVFCYNVEPGVGIDYATGDNWTDVGEEYTYILNTNSMKFHLSGCPGVSDIAEHNKQEFTGSRDELIGQGYTPCKTCNP